MFKNKEVIERLKNEKYTDSLLKIKIDMLMMNFWKEKNPIII